MDEQVEVRKELIDRLQTDLVGPESQVEMIRNKPLQKYLCGILWPTNSALANEENDSKESEGRGTSEEEPETLAPLAKAMNPSAIGISFLIDHTQPIVDVSVNLGMYHEEGEDDFWKRTPYQLSNFQVDFSKNVGKRNKQLIPDTYNVQIEWLSRSYGDTYAVSLFLVNRNKQDVDEHDVDHKCVFQPEISLTGIGTEPFVVRKAFSNNEEFYRDEDTKSNDLLYRDESVFAVGHSIAVHWDHISDDSSRAGKLSTKIIPTHEIPMVIPPDWDKGGTLDMRELAKMSTGKEIKSALSPLCDEYDHWIKKRKNEMSSIEDETNKDTAHKHMGNCDESLRRMREGLDLIEDTETEETKNILIAFKFMNQAMASQRSQTAAVIEGKRPEDISATWRPFQIAFILQNLKGIVKPESDDRKLADLLWFPTGGGKTEAYLGLAAFTLSFRRMREEQGLRNDAGVAVIMRYTLRLLTIQQFQRASSLICACEVIRKQQPNLLGERPFRIGLWVGDKSVPNKFDDALEVVTSIRDAINNNRDIQTNKAKGSPVQLVSCPWCGHALYDEESKGVFLKSYKPNKAKRRLFIHCPDKDCDFHSRNSAEGIPIVVTDEEIYRLLPDMIIGTVDKFAQMPWKPEVQNLFGKVKGEVQGWGFVSHGSTADERKNVPKVAGNQTITNKSDLYPPELIIQDELHLISGPLGTMVGLYETAIDYLSSVEINNIKIGPKVVASTATIRNAEQQISGLFTREARIFPSPGLSHKDSFFAKQRPLSEKPGRLYVGVFAPGRSMKTALLRVYANQLSSTTVMEDTHPSQALDPYQTLVGYFNSLRELGGAVRLIEDDVPSRMRTLENQTKENEENQTYKYKNRDYERDVPELTSRIDSSEIPKILKRLEQPFYKKGKVSPVDVLLASNMISVGVDVSRLGLMVVNGQPKTTAEYIQSTSRVGRTPPGLILNVYNWVRPRDISHYEEFHAYHAALYRYVEPISVTPFASRARDRGLAGALISMTRLGNGEMTPNNKPGSFSQNEAISKEIQDTLINRVRAMKAPTDEVLDDLQKLYKDWEGAVKLSELNYSYSKKKEVNNLMYPLGQKKNGSFKVPNSMRDVESTAGIYLRRD